MKAVVSILPKGEGFCPDQFGAVALCVRDFTLHSRYRAATFVIGGTSGSGFEGIRYRFVASRRRFWETRTRGYARGCISVIAGEQAMLTEVHNRPHLLNLIARKTGSALALHLHNDPQDMDDARTPRERAALLAHCGGVYCVSDYIRARFLDGLDDSAARKLHLVYNGIELPQALKPKENLIVFVGRMTEGKGALMLAQALRLALPALPDWRAVLIGSRRHAAAQTLTPYEKNVTRTLDPLKEQVALPGFLSHEATLAYFARAQIAVVPSLWQEPFGRTALEAMAYGCAVISSGTGGLKEVTGDAALTIPSLTAETLAEAIRALAENKAERFGLQAAGRTRAMQFSISRATGMLDAARDAILGKPAA